MKEISEALDKIGQRLFLEMGLTSDLEMMHVLLDLYNECTTLSEGIVAGDPGVNADTVEVFLEKVKSLS